MPTSPANPAKPYEAALPSNPSEMPDVSLDEGHSPLKVLAHRDLIRKFAAGEEFNPIHMRIGIQGACNMRCNFCNFHSSYETQFYDRFSYKDLIPTDRAIVLMTEFAATGGRAVTFCGSGECTTHAGYIDICRHAFGRGLRIGLITNGARLHKEDLAACIVETLYLGEDRHERGYPGDVCACYSPQAADVPSIARRGRGLACQARAIRTFGSG